MNRTSGNKSIAPKWAMVATAVGLWGALVLLFAAPLALPGSVSWVQAVSFAAAFWAFWLLFLIGCSSSYAGLFDDEEARRQIAAQQASIGDLRNKGQMLEARIAKMEEALNNQPLLELHNQMEALRFDLNKLHGQIEVLVNENELTQKRQKDFYIDLDSRLRRIEQPDESARSGSSSSSTNVSGAAPGSNVEAPAAVATVASPAASAVPGETAESRDYESAYSLFKTASAVKSFCTTDRSSRPSGPKLRIFGPLFRRTDHSDVMSMSSGDEWMSERMICRLIELRPARNATIGLN